MAVDGRTARGDTDVQGAAAGLNDARLLPPERPPPDEGLLRSERIAAVRSAFDRLSPHCRELLRLMFSDAKLTYEEIATLVDRPVGSLGPTRGRCLADLRGLLRSWA